ncbi:MAG: hypothetical protein JRH01_09875 [Deltaproteobacteria bacterium]|nr:hypothetical protein [Deltaproteobacteria bacterium]
MAERSFDPLVWDQHLGQPSGQEGDADQQAKAHEQVGAITEPLLQEGRAATPPGQPSQHHEQEDHEGELGFEHRAPPCGPGCGHDQ